MNKIHRLIWNEVTQVWVAVAEIAQGRSKRSGTVTCIAPPDAIFLPNLTTLAMSLALTAAALPGPTFAQIASTQLPTGGNVVAGTASITQNAAVMTINQTTNRAAIDWNTFNVGSAAQVNFNQPSSSSVTLNRVLDSNPSQIFGRITAPGQVFLVNPNGVFFAPGASVDVGGLVATTHRIGVDDFMAGKSTFERNGATGSVVNAGELKAALGGYIALLAPEVRNDGVIIAQAGTVALASGEAITLNFADNGTLAGITATQSQIAALVENKNAVFAPGGLIILSAMAANSLQAGVIKHSGTLSASSLTEKGGRILLEGDHISLSSGSQITATGASGGGEVLVGGDWQGGANTEHRVLNDPNAIKQATTVTMEAGATIDVSATQNGNGGTVVLWSDVRKSESVTAVAGTILAKGGAQGGNGGFVETSGARVQIGEATRVTTLAQQGSSGTWLIDPTNFAIVAGSGAQTTSSIGASTLQTNLGGGDVIIATSATANGSDLGDINVNAALSWSANRLTLTAHNNININDVLNVTGVGSATLTYSGKLTMSRNDATNSFTGKINWSSSSLVNINGIDHTAITTRAGLLGVALSGKYVLGNDIDLTTADWTVIASGATAFSGKLDGFGHVLDNLTKTSVVANQNIGLFGKLTGVVSNIGLTNVNLDAVNGSNTGSIAGVTTTGGASIYNVFALGSIDSFGYAAGLVGYVQDATTISKSYFSGNVNSSITTSVNNTGTGGLVAYVSGINNYILNSSSAGTVSGYNQTGGLVGAFAGTATATNKIESSWSSATITAKDDYVGGLVGAVYRGQIVDSYASGSVTAAAGANTAATGGLVGRTANDATILRSYATGNVTSSSYAGGLVGVKGGTGTVDQTYATGVVQGTSGAGGLTADHQGGIVSNSYYRGASVTSSAGRASGLIGFLGATATLQDSYAAASTVTGSSGPNSAGLVAFLTAGGTVTTSYFDNTILTGKTDNVAYGKSTTFMKTLSSFSADWNIATDRSQIWSITDGSSYPCLSNASSCPAFAYLRLITGSSVYGVTPTLTYGLYDASSAGTLISNASPTGTVTWSTVLSNTSAANTYSLTYSSGITLGSTAYSLQAGAAVNWTINTAPLTVTASNASKTYDGLAYTGGNGVTYSGFVNSQTAAVLGGTLGYAGTSQGATAAGSYIITPNGLTSSNYALTFVNGTLTVNAATSTTTSTTTMSAASPVIVPPVVNVAPSGSSGTSSDVSVGQTGSNGISISIDQDSTSGLDQSETRTVMLTVSLPSEMATAGNGFSFELPASVQALIGSDLPMIGLSDGSPLPAWIRFNPATMRFEAQAVPDGAFPLQVLISTSRTTVLIAISERRD